MYGWMRAARFLPTASAGYAQFLRQMPWHPGRPLPFGPASLDWQDALPVAVLSLTGFLLIHDWVILTLPPAAMLLTYTFYVAGDLTRAGRGKWVCLMLAIAAPAVHQAYLRPLRPELWNRQTLIESMLIFEAMLIVVYGMARLGLERVMQDGQWDLRYRTPLNAATELDHPVAGMESDMQAGLAAHIVRREARVGFPFARLAPRRIPPGLPRSTRVAISLTLGWCVFLIGNAAAGGPFRQASGSASDTEFAVFLFAFATLILAGARLVVYSAGHRSPLGPLARLVTGRWIIFSHDRILIAPLTVLVTGLCWGATMLKAELPAGLGFGAGLALTSGLAMLLPPSIGSWALTSGSQIVPLPALGRPRGMKRIQP